MEASVLASKIESVHVHRDGAVVTRALEAPASAAPRVARVTGLPLLLDDASVRISVEGPAVAVDLRVALEAASLAEDAPDERERVRLAGEVTRLENLLLHVDRVRAMVERTSVYRRPQPQDATPPIEVDVAARLALLDFRVSEMERLAKERAEVQRDLDRAQSSLAAFLERLHRKSGDRPPRPDELRKAAVFTLRPTGTPAALRIKLSYAVAGARWAPAYALSVDSRSGKAQLELRATISQATTEDWRGVALAVSSAPLVRPCDLPELTSLRVGRAQPPPKRGWRRPPGDVGTLLEDYRRALRRAPAPPVPRSPAAAAVETISHEEATPTALRTSDQLAEGAAMPSGASFPHGMPVGMGAPPAMGGFGGAPPMPGAAMPMAAPMFMSAPMPARAKARLSKREVAYDAGTIQPAARPVIEIEPDERLLSFGSLRMPAPSASNGALTIARKEDVYVEASATLDVRVAAKVSIAIAAAESKLRADMSARPWPLRHHPPRTIDGFDALYEASAPVDIPADGDFHSVQLLSAATPATLSFVVVPRETSDVFRRVEIVSPLDVPLLPGPCDVYTDGSFLLATDLEMVPARGRLGIGLGVDQSIKVARNVWHTEQTAGLMGGSLVLKHQIKVELVSHKSEAVSVEVRERVPVPAENEEDVRVELADVKPMWSAWEPPPSEPSLKGGYAWKVRLEPAVKTELEASYVVRIPAKLELVGGNRRD